MRYFDTRAGQPSSQHYLIHHREAIQLRAAEKVIDQDHEPLDLQVDTLEVEICTVARAPILFTLTSFT